MDERIYISEIQLMLHYKTRRSAKRWCKNNGIRIYCDFGTNRHYVLKDELENAKNKIYRLQQLKENPQEFINHHKISEYQPRGEFESNFFNFLQNI
jgi:hypothetical protein